MNLEITCIFVITNAKISKFKHMKTEGQNIRALVPHGGVKKIAQELGITQQAVSLALKAGKPSHPAVRLALSKAKDSGTIEAAQTLATIPQAA
ncbi:hypothetical protein [Hymenobacter bucti]|uniref:Uncharacterized protein n=1 Tax=Hymenobacter bucti TaxID=1844114 RepID=A0ABW4QWB1_9BACT